VLSNGISVVSSISMRREIWRKRGGREGGGLSEWL